jgi:hypothetical protein
MDERAALLARIAELQGELAARGEAVGEADDADGAGVLDGACKRTRSGQPVRGVGVEAPRVCREQAAMVVVEDDDDDDGPRPKCESLRLET